MPVEFCVRCGALRSMNVATSRIRVLLRGGKSTEITTKTWYCGSCRSFQFSEERGKDPRPRTRRRAPSRRFPGDGSRRSEPRVSPRSMKKALLPMLLLLLACQTVPITERRQLALIPTETILPMSFDAYQDFLAKHDVIENTAESRMVKRVGRRIAQAVERYFAEHDLSSELRGYAWEFNLVEDPAVNAWAMPGGKVVVYSGLLPVARNETGLAVVMGHEIAHAVANHGDERMSQGLLTEMGGLALSAALAQKPRETNQLFMAAYGIGAQIGFLLPYSRLHESEADHLGLIFMAMAGYDPREAVDFWQRMARAGKGPRPPQFLSTHPASEERIENIKELMPKAMKYYEQ